MFNVAAIFVKWHISIMRNAVYKVCVKDAYGHMADASDLICGTQMTYNHLALPLFLALGLFVRKILLFIIQWNNLRNYLVQW